MTASNLGIVFGPTLIRSGYSVVDGAMCFTHLCYEVHSIMHDVYMLYVTFSCQCMVCTYCIC